MEHQKHDLLLEEKAKPIATKKTKSQLFELRSERYDLEQSLLSDGLSKDLKKQIKQGLEMIDLKIDEHQRGDQQKEAKLLVDLELKASEISLEKQTKAYQTLLYDSEYKAPFSGVIEFSGEFLELHPDPEQKTIWVNANLNLGRLTDQSQSYIKLESSRAFWNQIPPSQLILSIADPRKGTRHKAPYSHSATGSLPNKNSKAHYFLLENHFLSPDEISSEQLYLVDVFRSFDHPKPIIPKKKLLSKDPDLLKHEGWAGLVEKFHPSYKIFQIGPEAIALELKEP